MDRGLFCLFMFQNQSSGTGDPTSTFDVRLDGFNPYELVLCYCFIRKASLKAVPSLAYKQGKKKKKTRT